MSKQHFLVNYLFYLGDNKVCLENANLQIENEAKITQERVSWPFAA